MIAGGFDLPPDMLHKRFLEVTEIMSRPIETEDIDTMARTYFRKEDLFPGCGLVVDATVQDRCQPAGQFGDISKYYSGKHYIYCLKSQVVTNRSSFAGLIHAAVPGFQHDLSLLRQTLPDIEWLILAHPGQPCGVLADKGFLGNIESRVVRPVPPYKQFPNFFLNPDQVRDNNPISHHRVAIENFFGRLSGKFRIVVRHWEFLEELYPKIFKTCCALVNFDIFVRVEASDQRMRSSIVKPHRSHHQGHGAGEAD
jgi:hypothetical protein